MSLHVSSLLMKFIFVILVGKCIIFQACKWTSVIHSWLFRMSVTSYLVNFLLSTNTYLSLTLHWSYFPGLLGCTSMHSFKACDCWYDPLSQPLGCKCLSHIHNEKSHFIIRSRKSCHCLALLILIVIIWLWVFDFLIFRVYFNICASYYPYLQACHIFTALKLIRICFKPCSVGLSEGRYWLKDPRLPQAIFSWALCWRNCLLYYGHWNWYVHCIHCYSNISSRKN